MTVPGVEAPQADFKDIVAPVALALQQERRVTEQINALAATARNEGDYTSEQVMQWFIKEQIEEVATMSDLLRVVDRSKDDPMDIENFMAREHAADAVIDQVNRFAPNFRASVLGRRVLSPLDLEREFGLVGGDIFHGKLTLNQLFSARPVLGHADYRMPLRGLYLCGSGAHPGGGVTGAPGHNAARVILGDHRAMFG